MSMITKCPSCTTAFRVTPQQLQAHHGMVRCGRCATVFDGFKTLAAQRADAPQVAAPAAAPSRSSEEMPLRHAPPVDHASVTPESASQPVAAQSAPAPMPPDLIIPREPALPDRSAPPPAIGNVTDVGSVAHSSGADTASTAPGARSAATDATRSPSMPMDAVIAQTEDVAGTSPGRSISWALAILVLLLTLAAQGIYFYRGEIAAHFPEARPYLNQACAQLRCSVALPQRPQQIKIAASDVQATDPANPGLMVVTATLRSESAVALGYPALDVVLTNVKDHTVARRIFLPSEYLDTGKDVRAGIPPNAEFTVALNIDSGDLGAAGFRLDVLAAPNP